jgi:hypothetical protein
MNDDQIHELKEKIAAALEALANKMLAKANLPANAEELIRMQLHEQVRYWK